MSVHISKIHQVVRLKSIHFNICKLYLNSNKAMELTLKIRIKLYYHSIVTKKEFDKINHPFTFFKLLELGLERNSLNLIKVVKQNPTENIILNVELPTLFSEIRKDRKMPFLPLLFNMVLEVLARIIKYCHYCKLTWLYTQKFKLFREKLLYIVNQQGFNIQSNYKKWLYFYNQTKIMRKIAFTIASTSNALG